MTIFLIEMLLKWTGLGLWGKHDDYVGYFNDRWNILDFLIVISSLASFAFSASNQTSVRVIRVLRPLRTISRIRGLRVLVQTLFNSMRQLAEVFVLLLFLFLVLGIFSVQFFQGVLRRRCFNETGVNKFMP